MKRFFKLVFGISAVVAIVLIAASYKAQPNVERAKGDNSPTGGDATPINGNVLPFSVVRAARNHGFKSDVVLADVSVSVNGGNTADWIATGVYVAQHSILEDATTAKVLVIVPNPGADFPPLLPKELAEIDYDPSGKVWPDKWGIFAAHHAASDADIEFYELANKFLDPNASDPDKDDKRADAKARRAVIKKYRLPANWSSKVERFGYYGISGDNYERARIHIAIPTTGLEAGLATLNECLLRTNGSALVQGCTPTRPTDY